MKRYGYTSDLLMHCTDWLPTLLGAINQTVDPDHLLDGVNMWESLANQEPVSPREEVLLNIDPMDQSMAMRKNNMKIVKGVPTGWSDWYPTPSVAGQYERRRTNMDISDSLENNRDMLDSLKNNRDDNTLHYKFNEQSKYVMSNPYVNEPEPIADDLLLPFSRNIEWNEALPVNQEYRHKSEYLKSLLKSLGRDLFRFGSDSGPLIIQCGSKPVNASNNCDAKKTPCLFDVVKDPCEYHNIASEHPEVVKEMEKRLAVYSKSMVAPRNQKFDPQSSPKLHGGAWVPWLKDSNIFVEVN